MAQAVGPEFKPQYHTHTKITRAGGVAQVVRALAHLARESPCLANSSVTSSPPQNKNNNNNKNLP
jgi:hypothetical protein